MAKKKRRKTPKRVIYVDNINDLLFYIELQKVEKLQNWATAWITRRKELEEEKTQGT